MVTEYLLCDKSELISPCEDENPWSSFVRGTCLMGAPNQVDRSFITSVNSVNVPTLLQSPHLWT